MLLLNHWRGFKHHRRSKDNTVFLTGTLPAPAPGKPADSGQRQRLPSRCPSRRPDLPRRPQLICTLRRLLGLLLPLPAANPPQGFRNFQWGREQAPPGGTSEIHTSEALKELAAQAGVGPDKKNEAVFQVPVSEPRPHACRFPRAPPAGRTVNRELRAASREEETEPWERWRWARLATLVSERHQGAAAACAPTRSPEGLCFERAGRAAGHQAKRPARPSFRSSGGARRFPGQHAGRAHSCRWRRVLAEMQSRRTRKVRLGQGLIRGPGGLSGEVTSEHSEH